VRMRCPGPSRTQADTEQVRWPTVAAIRPNASLKLFGSFALTLDGQPTPSLPRRVQALLALLVLYKGRSLPRELAADMLWTESAPQQARQSLRQALVTLRRVLGTEIVRANADSLSVVPDALVVDTFEFEALASSDRVSDLVRCAALCQGELLQNLAAISPRFDDWLGNERQRLAALAMAVFRRLADAQSASGDFDTAIVTARRLLEFDDLDEGAHRHVIRLLGQSGRRAEALRQYEVCVQTLKRELRVAPEPQTIELARTIRNGETKIAPPIWAAQPAIEPDRPIVTSEPPNISGFGGKRWRRAAAVLAAICIVAVAVVVAAGSRPVPIQNLPLLLVVPFTNNSTIGEDWLAAGVSSLIAEELRETYSLRVSQYRPEANDAVPVREHIAATPTIRYVLDGTASFSSPLDIAVHLTDRNGVTLWSDRYARPRSEVMHVAGDIATHISRAVASDSRVFRSGPEPVDHAKQTSRELLALAAFERRDVSDSSLVAFQQILSRAADLDPKNSEVLALLSGAYLTHFSMTAEDSDLTEADRYLDSALTLDQTNVGALWDKCFLRRMQGRYADGLEWCRRVLDINPHQAGALREVGHDLVALHDPAGAIPWFYAAIEATPDHHWVDNAYFGISEAEIELGHTEAAIAAAQEAVQHDHWGSFVGLYWAAALEIAGRDVEAKSALAQFYEHHPEFPPSDSLVTRVFLGYSMRPPILADAFRRLGLNMVDDEK
jgi:DNA-binding SARP family transcriptional activator/TolB-like protein